MVFDEYAQYYDLLYRDKDYDGEAEYIKNLLRKYAPNAKNIADLGCGTGRHAELLTKYGYSVDGVDMSEDMLQSANKRAENNPKLSFQCASIQDFHFEEPKEAVTALFHVISYQHSNRLLESAFYNIAKNIQQGGVFVFDLWYGPAVMFLKPELRVKRIENEAIKVTRIAEPVWRENDNIVEVHYDVFVEDKATGKIHEITENHVMRYFFKVEMEQFLNKYGFELVDSFEFFTGKALSRNTWGGCFVARRR